MSERRNRLRSPVTALVLAAMLVAGSALSGCTAVGAFAGFVAGAALGGPEGAVAGAEAGLYIGAAIDISVLDSLAEPHDDEWYADEWYAQEEWSSESP